MTELKPCPFCGDAPNFMQFGDDESGYFAIKCSCGAVIESEIYDSEDGDNSEEFKQAMIERWNRRADHA